jgi:4-diphosphocytidyl-2-C-methyl-D-erythritol kinase
MLSVAVFSPAKINLFLAVTGRRTDGFHDIVSLVAPLRFGDTIWLRRGGAADRDAVTLACDDPAVPSGAQNLAVRAAELFRTAARVRDAIDIRLAKRIPMGAGLGGGSSNAAAVLRGLNALFDSPLAPDELARLATELGSDCPLFLAGAPCVMRGRGERIELLPGRTRARLAGRRVLVFKPDFAISTPWAYARLAASGGAEYTNAADAESRLARWRDEDGRDNAGALAELLFNSFERVAFSKFVVFPALVEALRARRGVEGVVLSGSGSACFALLAPEADATALAALVRDVLGSAAFVVETALA